MQTTVKLLSQRPETGDSISFVFSRPKGFDYQAGQFMWLIIPHNNPDERGTRRHFTISSSPTEPDLRITTKFSDPGSSFKQALHALTPGSKIEIRGPHGEFTLPKDSSQPIVFLGGGIGITPFRAMIHYVTDKKLPTNLNLLYANKTPAEIVYRSEFDRWADENPHFQVHYTVDQPDEDWHGETGHLSTAMIKKFVSDLGKPLYYICGPIGMIRAYEKILEDLGINPDQIRTEDFSGYQ